MDNFVGRLIGGPHEEIIPSEPETEYKSVRVEEMMQSRSQFSSDADYEIAHSKPHWSLLKDDEDGDEDMGEAGVIQENRRVFLELMADHRWTALRKNHPFFIIHVPCSIVGRKIAEGGQAEIFESLHPTFGEITVLKVFRKGSRLSQLKQQWPSAILEGNVPHVVLHAFLLEDGRFAFSMIKCWGDLRKLIDQAKQAKNNQGPPFPFEWNGAILHAFQLMGSIASHMNLLHKEGIVHRDLKASNILLVKDMAHPYVVVADFECSIGVVGTGFWRAPEILLGLKNKTTLDYSEKVDVYGYAMTCYEIVTGLLPFEGELERGSGFIDLVIKGRRPKLPSGLDATLKSVIERCWDSNPLERPSFVEIMNILSKMIKTTK